MANGMTVQQYEHLIGRRSVGWKHVKVIIRSVTLNQTKFKLEVKAPTLFKKKCLKRPAEVAKKNKYDQIKIELLSCVCLNYCHLLYLSCVVKFLPSGWQTFP